MPDGFAPPQRLSFHLSVPPSGNNLYANTPHGRRKTPEYRRWLTASGWELAAQRVRIILTGEHFALHIRVPVNRRRDISNCIKAMEDLIVEQRIIPDDRWVDEITIKRDQSLPDMLVEIEVL